MSFESGKEQNERLSGPEAMDQVKEEELRLMERFKKTGHAASFAVATLLASLAASADAEETDWNQVPLDSYSATGESVDTPAGTDLSKIPIAAVETQLGTGYVPYYEVQDDPDTLGDESTEAIMDRATQIADHIGIEDTANLEVYAEGFVPTKINGQDVFDLLTPEEQEVVGGARRMGELMSGGSVDETTNNEVTSPQATEENPGSLFESKGIDPAAY